jgi:3-oxoacyl-[acyl-carrier protein] reductase
VASWSASLLNVLISGASRGLGLAIAERLAADGYRCIALSRRTSDDLETAIATARSGPGEIVFRAFDLTDLDAIPEMVRALKKDVGPLYGLVNNAGLGSEGLLSAMSHAQVQALVTLNTLAPILLAKSAIRHMMIEGRGRVINVASIIASTGFNGLSVYGATKASMIGFSKSLARELGRVNVTVNAVAPGFIETDMTAGMSDEDLTRIRRRSPFNRLAEPRDVAGAVAYLMGEDGRNVTGTVLTVDAGGTA